MPSVMVYTEETFYYEEEIYVIAKQEYFSPDETRLNFYMDRSFWFSFDTQESIYSMQGLQAIINYKLKEYGHTPDFKYSRKKIEYSYSDKRVFDKVIFYITESNQPGILSVMEEINQSRHMRAWDLPLKFDDFTGIRQFTDSVFYGMFAQQQS